MVVVSQVAIWWKSRKWYGAVQRGDAEVANKLNRVLRHMGLLDENPIKGIHDQGAGGMGNVTKELIEPKEGKFILRMLIQVIG